MSARRQPTPVRHPLFARCYARVGHLMDAQAGVADHRRRLLAGLRGRVVEVGAGNGLNFPHDPATVTDVVAVEPEPYLRCLALAAALQASVPIRVVDGIAEALPAADGVRCGGGQPGAVHGRRSGAGPGGGPSGAAPGWEVALL